MAKKHMPKSLRKYIRREKARIRREFLELDEQSKLINQLYNRFLLKPETKNIEKLKNKKEETSLKRKEKLRREQELPKGGKNLAGNEARRKRQRAKLVK